MLFLVASVRHVRHPNDNDPHEKRGTLGRLGLEIQVLDTGIALDPSNKL